MKKIDTDSWVFTFAEAGTIIGGSVYTAKAICTLAQPLLPAEVTLATKLGLYFGTYATGIVVSNRLIKDAKFMAHFYNRVAYTYNEKRQAERQENHG